MIITVNLCSTPGNMVFSVDMRTSVNVMYLAADICVQDAPDENRTCNTMRWEPSFELAIWGEKLSDFSFFSILFFPFQFFFKNLLYQTKFCRNSIPTQWVFLHEFSEILGFLTYCLARSVAMLLPHNQLLLMMFHFEEANGYGKRDKTFSSLQNFTKSINYYLKRHFCSLILSIKKS